MTITKVLGTGVMIALLSACATSSLFQSYPSRSESVKSDLMLKNFDAAASSLIGGIDSSDAELYLLELARVEQVAGNSDQSKASFEKVINLFEERDREAKIKLSDSITSGGSLLLNDNVQPYEAPFYEQVLAHHYQALNYWQQRKLEGAAVELRRARLVQEAIADHFEKEIAEAQESAQAEGVDIDQILTDYPGINQAEGVVKKQLQIAYTFYMSGAFWEAIGEYNDALVDYKKALEINSDHPQLHEDVKRLEARAQNRDQSRIWIFMEQGFVQEKQAFSLRVPTHNESIISLSVPSYPNIPRLSRALMVSVDSMPGKPTRKISDLSLIAEKHLQAQMPSLLLRQVLRGFTKHEVQNQAGKSFGSGGKLVANLFNTITEQADLRSWLSLPDNVQSLRLDVAPGEHDLSFRLGGLEQKVSLDVKSGTTYFIRVLDFGSELIIQQYSI